MVSEQPRPYARRALGALTATRTYAASTGQMLSFAYTAGNTLRRTQSYRYDLFANLSRRVLDSGVNGITATTETFGNDVLDRLTQSQRSGGATGTVTYAYASNGNLRTKSDYSLGNGYAYGAVGKNLGGNAGPHAVRQVQRSAEGGNGTVNFSYDNNGNLTAVTDPTLPFGALYDHRNLPTYVQRGAATSRLFYGADDQRARQTGSDGTHIYLPGFEDVIAAGGTAPVESRAYLGDYAVLARSANGDTLEYLLTDRLGSVDAVASTAGTITEKRAYDAFGAPRNGTTWANLAPKRLPSLAVTQKGYTAHEHLDSVELIHMNGRAYDYKVGRFLSVDPLITFPLNSQSLNPYSYVMNNPLSWTDPSGFSPCGIMVCPILPKRRFWMDEIREKYAFSIRPNGGGGGRIGVGSSRGRKTVATVEVLAISNGASEQHAEGAARENKIDKGASDLGTANARRGAFNASAEQSQEPAELSNIEENERRNMFRKMASQIEGRVDGQVKRDPYQEIEMPLADLAVLMESDRLNLRQSQKKDGRFAEMSFLQFLNTVRGPRGDGRFIRWAEVIFNVSGMPAPYAGRTLGSDLNYYFQGFVWRAGGYSIGQMNNAITVWNSAQVPTEGLRNIRQIPHAIQWAGLGYEYNTEGAR